MSASGGVDVDLPADRIRALIADNFAEAAAADPLTAAVEAGNERLRASPHDTDPIIESARDPSVERTDDGEVRVRFGWDHPAAEYLEYGTSAHTVDGDPVLSFVWDDPPQWVQDEFNREGGGYRVYFASVDVAGIEEVRFARYALRVLANRLAEVSDA